MACLIDSTGSHHKSFPHGKCLINDGMPMYSSVSGSPLFSTFQGYYEDAVLYYESALLHQSDFPPAQCRLQTTRCMLMLRYIMQLNRNLMKDVVGVKRTKSRGEQMKIVDEAVIDWLMEDKPFPLEQKALCVFSGGNGRHSSIWKYYCLFQGVFKVKVWMSSINNSLDSTRSELNKIYNLK